MPASPAVVDQDPLFGVKLLLGGLHPSSRGELRMAWAAQAPS